MTTLIIPTRGRVDILKRCLDSLAQTNKKPIELIIVCDNDMESEIWLTDYWLEHRSARESVYYNNHERLGFWQSINRAIEVLPGDEPFCYFGKDVVFDPDWLTHAEECFTTHYPSGLGLVSFRDDVVNHGNASHGMTTKRWLEVVFGYPHFPRMYWHHYCDSELTNRSRDFGRYTYCEASHVPHLHEPTGHDDTPTHINDQMLKDQRHSLWVMVGRELARERLNIALNRY
jgi:glycosyltransferase involved in cell wall biosynthesis